MITSEHDWPRSQAAPLVRQLELGGYTILPTLLDESQLRALRTAMESLPLRHSSYTDTQWFSHNVEWAASSPALAAIALPATLSFLQVLFADEVVCVSASYSRIEPGYPGMALHTDSHPYGSNILGLSGTSPVLVRILYYLDDLTAECAPLRVVPYSHLSLHADAMPYRRYLRHPEEVVLTCRAGQAIVINQRLFHAAGANASSASRAMFAVSYRPAWAGPTQAVPEPPAELIARLPEGVRRLFQDPNRRVSDTTIVNWSRGMPEDAPGLGPGRWSSG